MSADYPDLPYVHAIGDGGPRSRTQVIIIHATDNTAPASGEASYATRREDGTSAHYYVDDNVTIQALPIGNIAYGALWHGNQVGVQYELCGRSNQLTDATIRRAAAQVARDCARYGIPVRKLTAAQVRAGERGICGHADVTLAWPEDGGDHTDPGNQFPWSTFIGYVAGNPLEDDMPLTNDELYGIISGVVNGSTAAGYIDQTAPPAYRAIGKYNIRALDAKLDAILRAQGMAQADIDELQARPAAGLTDAQVKELAAALAAEVDPAAVEATLVDVLGRVGFAVRPA